MFEPLFELDAVYDVWSLFLKPFESHPDPASHFRFLAQLKFSAKEILGHVLVNLETDKNSAFLSFLTIPLLTAKVFLENGCFFELLHSDCTFFDISCLFSQADPGF